MKLLTTTVTMLLALSLWAGSNSHDANDKGRDNKPGHQQRDEQPKEKPDHGRDRDHDHGKGKGKDNHHDPRDCDDDRHDHGHPKPPKPPKDPAGVPAAPTGLSAQAVSLFQVNLTWTDNATNELGFKVERSLDGTNYAQIAQVLPNTTTYRDLNRFPDTKYFYRARAFNAKGSSAYSAIARTQTPAPECKLSVVASSGGFNYGGPSLDGLAIVAVAPGYYRGLALKADGTVIDDVSFTAVTVSNLSDVVAIAASGYHNLALVKDGTVIGWGYNNYYGQASVPLNLSNVTAVAAGGTHSLALKIDGTVVAWGNDTRWQSRVPTNLTGVVAISAGADHSLALRSDGTVVGWGWNDQNAAQPPPDLGDVIAISAGTSHSLALKSDGTVIGWGTSPAAVIPTNLTGVVAIAAGENYSAVLKSDGTVIEWSGLGSFPSPVFPITSEWTGVVAIGLGQQYQMLLATLPSIPSALQLKLHSNQHVELTWPDASASETAYIVERTLPTPPGASEIAWEIMATLNANSTNYVDTTASAGETYWYMVRPQNDCGIPPFGPSGGIKIAAPSSAPYFSFITTSGTSVTLVWYGESVGALEYRIERAPDVGGFPGAWNEIAVLPTPFPYSNLSEADFTDTNLAVNSTNWYRVRAVNGLGNSPYSEPRSAVIHPPTTPRFLTATIQEQNYIQLTWGADYWNELAGFNIERATNSTGPWQALATLPATKLSASQYADSNVQAGLTYWYRVSVFTEAGTSEFSAPVSVSLVPPTSVGWVYAFALTNAAILSAYLPNPFDSAVGQPPQFERAVDVNGAPGVWTAISPEPFPNHPPLFIDPDLAANQTYWYRAKFSTWLGDSPWSEPVSVTVVPPMPPFDVRARIGTTNCIQLSWRPTSAPILWGSLETHTGFKIERAMDTGAGFGDWIEIATVGQTNSQSYHFTDTVTGAGQTYLYRVSAFNIVGQSAYAESFPVTLTPPPQPTLGASVYVNQISLNWDVMVPGVMGCRLQRAVDASGQPGAWIPIATFPPAENYPRQYTDIVSMQEAGYWYRIQAFNWVGDSEFSPSVLAQVQRPATPVLIAARVGNTNQLELAWNHERRDAEVFVIERARKTGEALEPWSEVISVRAVEALDFFDYRATDSNVLAVMEYAYRMRATNSIGLSPYSDVFVARAGHPPTPQSLSAAYLGGRVTLQWSTGLNQYDYGTVNGYEVERAVDVGGIPGAWTSLGVAYDFFYQDNEPPPGITCWYSLRSVNWVGTSEPTPAISVAIAPPPRPHLTQVAIGPTNQVRLTIYTEYPHDHDGLRIERAPDFAGSLGTWEEIAMLLTNASGLTFTDTNVVAYTTNWYRARAFHRGGLSEYSPPASIAIVPPAAPSIFNVSVAADEVRLFWQLYTSDMIGGFQLERAPNDGGAPGAWSQIAAVSGNFNPSGWWDANYTNIVAIPAATFWYRVRAYNWVGEGTVSEERSATMRPPTKPFWAGARIGPNTNEVIVEWWGVPLSTNGGYQIERAADEAGVPGSWSEIGVVTNYLADTFVDTNALAFTTNWYRVRAFDVLGVSPYSEPVELRIIPPPPVGTFFANAFANDVQLTWLYPGWPANPYGLCEFTLERASDVNGSPGIWSALIPDPKYQWAGYAMVDFDLEANATYWYRIYAHNWVGISDPSAAVSVTITPPDPPSLVAALQQNDPAIALQVTAAMPFEQDGFKIERSTDEQASWSQIRVILATNSWGASYTDSRFVPNVTNYYRVRAFNIVGDSEYSATVSAVISMPSALIASTVLVPAALLIESLTTTNQDVLITWTGTGGTTNVVEATSRLREDFTPISANVRLEGVGNVTTNFLDAGALTNSASRFYRIRVVP